MEKLIALFGRRLRTLRKSRGLTLEQLGRAAGVGFKHISEIERGVKVPSFEVIGRLAQAMDVEPYELFLPDRLGIRPSNRALRLVVADLEKNAAPAMKKFLLDVLTSAQALSANE